MAAVTRLGLYGGPRGLYGDFAGKTEQVIVPEPEQDAATGGWEPTRRWKDDPYTRAYQSRRDRAEREQAEQAPPAEAAPKPEPDVEAWTPSEDAADADIQLRIIAALEAMEERGKLLAARKRAAAVLMLL